LLNAGADVRARDTRGRSAVWLAAARGDSPMLAVLVTAGGKAFAAQADAEGSTPLHAAAGAGHDGIVARLLALGVGTNTATRAGNTPLHIAAAAGQVAVLQRLLVAKAEIDAKNNRGDTPVFVAVRARQLEALRALVKAGADRRLRNADGQNAAEVATAAGFTELVPLLKR
jgi:ankyrin repeat protein